MRIQYLVNITRTIETSRIFFHGYRAHKKTLDNRYFLL